MLVMQPQRSAPFQKRMHGTRETDESELQDETIVIQSCMPESMDSKFTMLLAQGPPSE